MRKLALTPKTALLSGLFLCLVMMASPALAGITYSLTDLTDTEENLYQITYNVSGFDSTTYAGFDIYFEDETYSDISLDAWDSSNWDEPYVFLGDSIYGEREDWTLDAYASVLDENLSGYFTVSFYYTGEGLPGTQDIEYYDADYTVVATGQTSAVPIPGSALLLLTGLAGVLGFRKKNVNA